MTILCIPHAQDLVRGGPGCTLCALEARLAEAERLLREIENDFPNRFSRRAYEYFNPRPTVSASGVTP